MSNPVIKRGKTIKHSICIIGRKRTVYKPIDTVSEDERVQKEKAKLAKIDKLLTMITGIEVSHTIRNNTAVLWSIGRAI